MAQCEARRRDGERCTGRALPGQALCFAHAPSLGERRRAGSAKGGQHKRTGARIAKLAPGNLKPVLEALYETLDGLKEGRIEPRQGTAIATVAGAIVKCHETAELELTLTETLRRLDALERGRAS